MPVLTPAPRSGLDRLTGEVLRVQTHGWLEAQRAEEILRGHGHRRPQGGGTTTFVATLGGALALAWVSWLAVTRWDALSSWRTQTGAAATAGIAVMVLLGAELVATRRSTHSAAVRYAALASLSGGVWTGIECCLRATPSGDRPGRGCAAQPPATAGMTEIWLPSGVAVSRLSRKRTSSLPT